MPIRKSEKLRIVMKNRYCDIPYDEAIALGDCIRKTIAWAELESKSWPYGSAFRFYGRSDIQREIHAFCKGRTLLVRVFNRDLLGRVAELEQPEDFVLLMLLVAFERHRFTWPSLFCEPLPGTIPNAGGELVVHLEGSGARSAFQFARPVVDVCREFEIPVRMKFGGRSTVELLFPASLFDSEAPGTDEHRIDSVEFTSYLSGYAYRFSSSTSNRMLPLSGEEIFTVCYGLHEDTALVNVPISMDNFEDFHLDLARPEYASVLPDWNRVMSVSTASRHRTRKLMRYLSGSSHRSQVTWEIQDEKNRHVVEEAGTDDDEMVGGPPFNIRIIRSHQDSGPKIATWGCVTHMKSVSWPTFDIFTTGTVKLGDVDAHCQSGCIQHGWKWTSAIECGKQPPCRTPSICPWDDLDVVAIILCDELVIDCTPDELWRHYLEAGEQLLVSDKKVPYPAGVIRDNVVPPSNPNWESPCFILGTAPDVFQFLEDLGTADSDGSGPRNETSAALCTVVLGSLLARSTWTQLEPADGSMRIN
jgi:hypothetical protein